MTEQNTTENKRRARPKRLKVWQRLFIAVLLLAVLGISSTLFTDFARQETVKKLRARICLCGGR